MTDSIIAFVAIAGTIAFGLFCLAWITVLPTIGLLYWMGYLQ